MEKIMNWLRSGKHRAAATIGALFVLAVLAQCAEASENPVPIGKAPDNSGWLFQMPSGQQWYCGRISEFHAGCVDTESKQTYKCSFEQPPRYFADCKEEVFE
jgi:hypothetical protein